MKEQEDRQKVKLQGQLKLYILWPVLMIAPLALLTLAVYKVDKRAGVIMLAANVIYVIVVLILYINGNRRLGKELVVFATQYGLIQNKLLDELAIPFAILWEDGTVAWMNEEFTEVLDGRSVRTGTLSRHMPEINRSIFPTEEEDTVEVEVFFDEKEYRAEMKKLTVDTLHVTTKLIQVPENRQHFITVYLHDVTELNAYIRENEEQRLVAGLVYIDNYDEVVDSVEDVRKSLLIALVERKINQHIGKVHGIVRKMENDKYFIAVQKSAFTTLERDKFALLEDVKSINVGNSIPATVSIGLGHSEKSYSQSFHYARVAIDLALARGGDQAVIKDGSGITYYGGKREQTSKNTRVKARVKAEALREFINVRDQIFVMGHKLTDVDALGAAIGIYRASASLGKRAYIVINEVSASLRPIYKEYANNPDYPEDLFIDSEQALELADEKSLIIVVDTNRPGMTECEELLRVSKTLVVLDHHRQSADNIQHALLSYIEPYASSTCEMVSEVLQYIADDIKIPKLEASTMYAGIMVDTNNFAYRTGVRTFEAAAFLRRAGADLNMVRKLFREDMKSYQVKAAIIAGAQVYRDRFAIAENYNTTNVESPTILGAQAANELLDIGEIKASFVFTPYNGKIYLSARSIDEVNVQVITEKLGGGGHINAAGSQFDHLDMERAIGALKQVLDEKIEKGEI